MGCCGKRQGVSGRERSRIVVSVICRCGSGQKRSRQYRLGQCRSGRCRAANADQASPDQANADRANALLRWNANGRNESVTHDRSGGYVEVSIISAAFADWRCALAARCRGLRVLDGARFAGMLCRARSRFRREFYLVAFRRTSWSRGRSAPANIGGTGDTLSRECGGESGRGSEEGSKREWKISMVGSAGGRNAL
jgi:hypothetical protein